MQMLLKNVSSNRLPQGLIVALVALVLFFCSLRLKCGSKTSVWKEIFCKITRTPKTSTRVVVFDPLKMLNDVFFLFQIFLELNSDDFPFFKTSDRTSVAKVS